MKPDSSIDPVLQPLEDNPFQALLSDQFQISDILEWVLNQFGPSDILQSSFSIAEEYIRKIISLKEENLISSIVLLLDYKATNKTIDLWHFMGAVFDSTFLSQNHSKIREFGIRNAIKKLNRQLEKVAYSFGNFADI